MPDLYYSPGQIKNNVMKKNVGTIDRVMRILIAIAITILYYTGELTGPSAIVLMVIAAILLITGLIGWCPIYALLKRS